MRLKERVAVVTGGGRGIGAATCRRLAAEGAAVAPLDLDGAAAEEVAAAIRAAGGRARAFTASVTDRAAVEAAMAGVVAEFGRLDVLVNNAGIIRDNLLFKMSDDDWDLVLTTHLKGAFICSQAAQRHMVQQQYGRIICLSSTSALGNRGQANYSAAKMGMQGFARTLAIELGRFNITANCVAPGFIETDMARSVAARLGMPWDEFARGIGANTAIGRIGQPEEVAGVIAFLASDDAGYVSGQTIYVCGGPE